jgi:hypothetical protein
MSTIWATCTGCGDIWLRNHNVVILTDGDRLGARFTCPHCRTPRTITIDGRYAELLFNAGCDIAHAIGPITATEQVDLIDRFNGDLTTADLDELAS